MKCFCFRRLGCCLTKYFASKDLVVVLMEKFLFPWTWLSSYGKFCSIDLIVVLWKISVPWTWLSSYGKLCFRGLGCRPMESFCSKDLVVVLWKKFLFHGLDCCPMEDFFFVPMNLVVVL